MSNGADAIKAVGGAGDSWSTPYPLWAEILTRYYPAGSVVFDPCPNRDRILPGTFTTPHPSDGLAFTWRDRFFVNPPWSDITPWVRHALASGQRGVFLIPTRTDQRWFQEVGPRVALVHIGGRVNYINPATGTTQVIDRVTGKLKPGAISCPSSLLIFGADKPWTVEYWTPDCHLGRKTKARPKGEAPATKEPEQEDQELWPLESRGVGVSRRGMKPKERAEERASMEMIREVKKRLPAWQEEGYRLAHLRYMAEKRARVEA